METIFPFQPSNQTPPQFSPTFDGTQYTVILTWSLFGQRYYINIYTLAGVLIVSLPLVESPSSLPIESLSWDLNTSTVSLITANPHGFSIDSVTNLAVSGCTPDVYNGTFLMVAQDTMTLQYALSPDPGLASALGAVSYDISMTAGYFASTLVFRGGQFIVSP